MSNDYLTRKIETNKKIEASPFTAEELSALQKEARVTMARATRFDAKMDLTNKALDESERLWDLSDVAFDKYNAAIKVVQTFAAVL
jgi:hypothetical protein